MTQKGIVEATEDIKALAEPMVALGDEAAIPDEEGRVDMGAALSGDEEQQAADPVPTAEAPVAEAVPAPAAAEPAPASLTPERQAYYANLERKQQEADARASAQQTEERIVALQQEYEENDGLTPVRARNIAEQVVTADQRAQQQVVEAQAKVAYAARLADKHKIPVSSLMQHNTPGAMDAAVESIVAETAKDARITSLETQVAALKKGQVPPQSFDNNTPSSVNPTSRQGLLQRVADGYDPTESEWTVINGR